MILSSKLTVDSDTVLGHRQAFDNVAFVFDLADSTPSHNDSCSYITTSRSGLVAYLSWWVNILLYIRLFNTKPCCITLPHVYQFATELSFLIKRSQDQHYIYRENGGHFIMNDIWRDVYHLPPGTYTLSTNLCCKPPQYINTLNHEDPRILSMTTQVFRLLEEAVEGPPVEDNDIIQKPRMIDHSVMWTDAESARWSMHSDLSSVMMVCVFLDEDVNHYSLIILICM